MIDLWLERFSAGFLNLKDAEGLCALSWEKKGVGPRAARLQGEPFRSFCVSLLSPAGMRVVLEQGLLAESFPGILPLS